ncbi:MAG: hypothetical protein QOK37_489 [Thermoanaerobaculia bacterium]|jgi:hypothetical protein|nr:hypothetical protein [Thermoanaerobaculia bacterium]
MGWPLLGIGLICVGVSAQIWFARNELAPVLASSQNTLSETVRDAPPNIVADGYYVQAAHVDHTRHVKLGHGTRFDQPYLAAYVDFRNGLLRGRKVGDAYDLTAEVRLSSKTLTRDVHWVGYWRRIVEAEASAITLTAGGAARALILALRDTNTGVVYAVEDVSPAGHNFPVSLMGLWQPGSQDETYVLTVLIAREGTVLTEEKFVLRIGEQGIELRRP